MPIYNLTQHSLTEEQKKDNIQELPAPLSKQVRELLTFIAPPTLADVQQRAEQLAELAVTAGAEGAMLGGAPFLMAQLTQSLKQRGVRTYFSFSLRRSKEVHQPDGRVEKHSVFSYEGLVEV